MYSLLRRTISFISQTGNGRTLSNVEIIKKEKQYTANTYDSIPVSITKGEGVFVWDVEGRRYFDMLSGYSALSLGHAHPGVLSSLQEQASKVHHVSRAFHSQALAEYAEFLCEMMQYDKMIPMNTGVEAVDASIKLARRWGYLAKGIPEGRVKIVLPKNNFWGRSLAAITTSGDPVGREYFGPYLPGFDLIPYDDLEALEIALQDPEVAAYLMEPIQGEAGVVVPRPGYLKGVRGLCDKYNVLWIADEVQTGLYRTAKLLCVDHEGVRPDILTLGKALSAGMFPVSATLASDGIMRLMGPGSHGSTFGGCPLGSRVALAALQSLQKLDPTHLELLGQRIRQRASELPEEVVSGVRGKGILNAVQLRPEVTNAGAFCRELAKRGVLCSQGKGSVIRLSPPLVITLEQIDHVMDVIHDTCDVVKSTVSK